MGILIETLAGSGREDWSPVYLLQLDFKFCIELSKEKSDRVFQGGLLTKHQS